MANVRSSNAAKAPNEIKVPEPKHVCMTAGEKIEDLSDRWVKSFIAGDRKAYDQCHEQYEALKECMANLRKAVCLAYDNTQKGYTDNAWQNPKTKDSEGKEIIVQRLVKSDPDNKRGRKPTVKVKASSKF